MGRLAQANTPDLQKSRAVGQKISAPGTLAGEGVQLVGPRDFPRKANTLFE